jgi:hypothetical protein
LGQVKAELEEEEEERLKEEAQSQAEKREDKLRKSIETLLGKSLQHLHPSFLLGSCDSFFIACSGAVDTPVDCTSKLWVDSMTNAISFAMDSYEQIQELLKMLKASLSKLYTNALVFLK